MEVHCRAFGGFELEKYGHIYPCRKISGGRCVRVSGRDDSAVEQDGLFILEQDVNNKHNCIIVKDRKGR